MLNFNRPHLTQEEFHGSAEWKRLSEQRKLFVQTLIDSDGDQTFAASTAYSMTDDECARKSSYALLRLPAVKAAIDLYLKKDQKELLVEQLDRIINSKGIPAATRLRAIESKMELLGVKTPAPEPEAAKPAHIFNVGDIVTVGGRRVRVTVVSPDGLKALEGDPI
jgi:hypothetical protein